MGGTLDAVSRLSKDPGYRFDQVLDDRIGLDSILLRHLGDAPHTRTDENGASTHRFARVDILPAIANGKGALEIEVEIGGGPAQQSRPRLSAFTLLSIPGDNAIGMVGTIVEGVYARASSCDPVRDELVGFVDECFRQQTTCDARLVRDDHDGEAGTIEQPHGIDGERKERQTIETVQVSGLFDQGPVAIEEHCGFHSLVRVGPHPHALSLGGAASRRFPPAPRSGRRRC